MKAVFILSVIGFIIGTIVNGFIIYTVSDTIALFEKGGYVAIANDMLDDDDDAKLDDDELSAYIESRKDEVEEMKKNRLHYIISIPLLALAFGLGYVGPNIIEKYKIKSVYLGIILLLISISLIYPLLTLHILSAFIYITVAILFFMHGNKKQNINKVEIENS